MRQVKDRIDPLQIGGGQQRGPVGLQSVSAPAAPPGLIRPANDGAEVASILHAFSGGIERVGHAMDKRDAQIAADVAKAGAAEGMKTFTLNPSKALYEAPAIPEDIPPAFHEDFQRSYRESVGAATAARGSVDMLADYESKKNTEGFDPEGFLKQWTEKEYAGINDPLMMVHIAKRVQETALQIRQDHNQLQQKQLKDTSVSNLGIALQGILDTTKDPAEVAAKFHNEWAPMAMRSGLFTRPEIADNFIETLNATSIQRGGDPDLLAAARVKGEGGIAPGLSSPALQAKLVRYEEHAKAQRDGRLKDELLMSNSVLGQEYDELLTKNPFDPKLDDENLRTQIGKFGLFNSDSEYRHFVALRNKARGDQGEMLSAVELIKAGQGGLIADSKVANKAMAMVTGPIFSALQQAVVAGDDAKATLLAQQMAGLHANAGVAVNDEIKNYLAAAVSRVSPDGKIPAGFESAAKVYDAMARNPMLAEKYAPGDVGDVFDAYRQARMDGADAATAYATATYGMTKEGKAKAEELRNNKEWQAKIGSTVHNVTQQGFLNWFQRKVPFAESLGLSPENRDVMERDARVYVNRLAQQNPNLSESQLLDKAEKWAAKNYLYDRNLNQVVKMPPGMTGERDRDMLEAYTADLVKKYGKDAGYFLHYDPATNEMRVGTSNPPRHEVVSLDTIRSFYQDPTVLSKDEREQVAAWQQGNTTVVNPQTLAKAKALGIVNKKQYDQMVQTAYGRAKEPTLYMKDIQKRQVDALSMQGVGATRFDGMTMKPTLDKKQEVADLFTREGAPGMALTTMAEGVALTAYNDAVGKKTIGIGYNMDANAATLAEDFRRAGIEAKDIEDIKAGKVSITREQAMRLLKVTYPRYEDKARAGFEKKYPGEWDNLPLNHKAVLTDLAYQVGSVDKFPKAMEALFNGDVITAGEELTVKYADQKSGTYKPDVGRRNLRNALLNSTNGLSKMVALAK